MLDLSSEVIRHIIKRSAEQHKLICCYSAEQLMRSFAKAFCSL